MRWRATNWLRHPARWCRWSKSPSEDADAAREGAAAKRNRLVRDGIVGVEWHFFEFESGDGSQVFVDDPSRYTLLLNPDGTATVKADCNNGSGSYQLDGSSLTIDIVAVTRALCPPDSLSEDYLRLLGDVVTYVEKDDVSGAQSEDGRRQHVLPTRRCNRRPSSQAD